MARRSISKTNPGCSDGEDSTTSRSQSVEVNPVLPYLYLPKETCDAVAANLPITYNEDLNLYFWNTDDDTYQNITSSPAYLSFTFEKNARNDQNMSIKVPFQLLKLTLQEPLVEQNTTYFPCYPSDSYTLGRAFLQAAFIGVNWHEGNGSGRWFLAQAPGPAIGTGNQQIIGVNDDTVEASKNSWETSSNGCWTPLPLNKSSNQSGSSSSLSVGAKAGIGIGCAIGTLGFIGILAWLCITRRKRATNPHQALVGQHNTATTSFNETKTTYVNEMDSQQLNKLQSDRDVQEAPGSTTMRHELM